MPRRLILTRPEFASFLKDPRQIREFERLFDTVSEHDSVIQDAQVEAGEALSSADLALGLIAGIQELVDLLSQAPAPAHVGETPVEPPSVPYTAPDDVSPPTVPEPREGDVMPPVVVVAGQDDLSPPVVVTPCCEDVGPLPAPSPIPDELYLAALAPAIVPAKRKRYGAFHSEVTQTPITTDTNTIVTYDTTELSHGVWTDSEKVYVDTEGVYNFQFSVQITTENSANVRIWPKINGTNVPWACSVVNVQNANDAKVASWNWLLQMSAGDYFELWWRSSIHLASLTHFAASDGYSAVPSVILTVTECTGDANHGGNC